MDSYLVRYEAPHETGHLSKSWNAPSAEGTSDWTREEAQWVADYVTEEHPDWQVWVERRGA